MPFVSVIIPCRNERDFIMPCLASVLSGDYPTDRIEILVVDGSSDDGTVTRVAAIAAACSSVRLIPNPVRTTPAALNSGIRESHGEVVIRLDAHSVYGPDYIRRCITALQETGADSVGGVFRVLPRSGGWMARTIVRAQCHPFGVGYARYRFATGGQRREAETVAFFCCRREVFARVGLFNEQLARGQDMEFNQRLRAAGGRIVLDPAIVVYYYPRTDLKGFLGSAWQNGRWAVIPFLYSSVVPVRARHLVPLVFVVTTATATMLAVLSITTLPIVAIAVAYGCAALSASVGPAMRQDAAYLLTLPPAFLGLHVAYGLGSVAGLLHVIVRFLRPSLREQSASS